MMTRKCWSIWSLLGIFLLALVLLAAGCGEMRKRPAGPQPSPTEEAYPPPPEWTPEPTAPPLPTITPVLTVPTTPTPTRVPGPPKPTPLVTPIVPFPMPALSPTPVGEPPPGLQTIWYPHLASPDGRPMLQAVLVDEQGRRWGELGRTIDLGLIGGFPGPWLTGLHMSPDGRSFVADVQYGDVWYRSFWTDPASGEFQLIADAPGPSFLSWAPDRQVFVGNLSYYGEAWLLDLDTQEQRVYLFPFWEYGFGVRAIATSPDGSWVADASIYGPTVSHPGTDIEIGLQPLAGGDRVLIAAFHVPEGAETWNHRLVWSPNGQTLALMLLTHAVPGDQSKRDGQLWLVERDGDPPTTLAHGLMVEHLAIWSPDGRYIAFIRSQDPWPGVPANLWLLDLGTSAEIQLTDFTDRRVTSFAWSPDGEKLAFAVTLGDYGEVWITSLDGTEQYPVAGPTAPDAPVGWLPAMVQR